MQRQERTKPPRKLFQKREIWHDFLVDKVQSYRPVLLRSKALRTG